MTAGKWHARCSSNIHLSSAYWTDYSIYWSKSIDKSNIFSTISELWVMLALMITTSVCISSLHTVNVSLFFASPTRRHGHWQLGLHNSVCCNVKECGIPLRENIVILFLCPFSSHLSHSPSSDARDHRKPGHSPHTIPLHKGDQGAHIHL